MMTDGGLRRVWRPPFRVDARLTLSDLQHGTFDPCHHLDGAGNVWRCSRLASGEVTYRFPQREESVVVVDAWAQAAASSWSRCPSSWVAAIIQRHSRPSIRP